MGDFDFDYNDQPVCPHCRVAMTDAWELDMDDGEVLETECGSCEKPIRIVAYVSWKYSTSIPD